MQGIRDYGSYWKVVVRMWWHDNFKNWIGGMGVVVTFGLLITMGAGVELGMYAWWILGSVAFALLLPLVFWIPYKLQEESSELLKSKREQFGEEHKWLYPVVERIDLEKGKSQSNNQIAIKFSIDSGLVSDFRPARMWITPILDGWETNEPEYEFIDTPNFLWGKRHNFSTERITIKDGKLLELIEKSREGEKVSKALKIEIQLRTGHSVEVLRSEPYY